jgi:hypothetical protein
MSVIKIFDRNTICQSICSKDGLLNIVDLFRFSNIDLNNISNIVNSYICNDTFSSLVIIACEICKLPPSKIAVYYLFTKDINRCWFLHPILIKSILRHVDNLINKYTIVRIVYKPDTELDFFEVTSCSLLSIVENIAQPIIIKYSNDPQIVEKKYNCEGILNKYDMFNDDHLIIEFIKRIMLEFLPSCLCDMICSMVTV